MASLTVADINDIVRGVWSQVRVVFFGAVASASNQDKIIRAVQDYRFPANSGCIDHDFAIFEVDDCRYFFSMDGTTVNEGPEEEKIKTVVTIGRADEM